MNHYPSNQVYLCFYLQSVHSIFFIVIYNSSTHWIIVYKTIHKASFAGEVGSKACVLLGGLQQSWRC